MSLRSRNRLALRRSVQAAALALFEDQGFEAVTVEQVAADADVSVSTLYRHFGTKEQLVLWDERDGVIEEALGKTLGQHAPLEALARAFVAGYRDLSPAERLLLYRRGRLIDANPTIFAAMAASLERDRAQLERALEAAYGTDDCEMRMQMVARIALTALIAGFDAWQAQGAQADLPGAIERAFRATRRALE